MQDNNIDTFRTEVRAFLANSLTAELTKAAELGFGIGRSDGAKWHKALFDQGWVAPEWPVEHGGTGWSATQQRVFSEELALADPDLQAEERLRPRRQGTLAALDPRQHRLGQAREVRDLSEREALPGTPAS